jgi:photosystem I subunit 2
MKLNKYLNLPIFNEIDNSKKKLNKIQEKYVICWRSSKEHVFELPTGGTALMRKGENILYFSRKEQCLALIPLFKIFKVTDLICFRFFRNCEIQYLYPKDGMIPDKVNAGRLLVNYVPNSI